MADDDALLVIGGITLSAMLIHRTFGTPEIDHPCAEIECPPGQICQAGDCIDP